MKKSLFTLTELLTVIAIIAVLAGLLMPALGKAREKAYNIACVNNVRNIAQGISFYCDDNKEYYPLASGYGKTAGGNSCAPVPFHWLIYRYISDGRAFECPVNFCGYTKTYAQDGVGAANLTLSIHYLANFNIMPFADDSYQKRIWVKQPSKLMLTGEEAEVTNGPTFGDLNLNQNRFNLTLHGDSANYAFADCHVETLRNNEMLAHQDSYMKWEKK